MKKYQNESCQDQSMYSHIITKKHKAACLNRSESLKGKEISSSWLKSISSHWAISMLSPKYNKSPIFRYKTGILQITLICTWFWLIMKGPMNRCSISLPSLWRKLMTKVLFFVSSGSYDQLRKAALKQKQVNSSIKK